MIIATAGHIDHGKTTLVAAITGQSTDRLPEEKRRGISIEVGFAHWAVPDGSRDFNDRSDRGSSGRVWSFVDVPGHERFVRHMIAGVQHIDAVLMVVAADDGIMPQTREHAEILSMLGHRDWVVALTKIDRVDSARRHALDAEILDWLSALGLVAPVIEVDSPRGQGIHQLIEALAGIDARRSSDRQTDERGFRMAVDRSFVLSGEGLVVTGTVLSGRVERDQRLVASPSGLPVRVRAIRVAGQAAESACLGQRCALNLSGAGVERGSVERGDWLLDPPMHAPTACVDVAIRWLNPSAAIRRVFTGHIHLGAALMSAQISPLGSGLGLEPGSVSGVSPHQFEASSMLARVHLQTGSCVAIGDRWIIRSADAAHTLGVAQVLLPMPRLTAQRGAAHALSLRTIERSLSALAAARAECWARCAVRALSEILPRLPTGLSARDWHVAWYLSPAVPGGEVESGAPMIVRQRWRAEERWFDAPRLRALSQQILNRIAGHHREAPSELGLTLSSLMASLSASDRLVLAPVSLERLIAEGSVRRVGDRLAQPAHRPRADPQDERFWLQVEPELSQERSISIHELADRLVMTPEAITEALERQARLGRVVRVAVNRYLTLARFEGLLEQARDLAAQGRLSAAEFNRATALGRNLTIEVLETFDRLRYTRRLGGLRLMNGS